MNKKDEVESFLESFKIKLKVFQIIFRDERKKNTKALLELDISPIKRKEAIENLELEDFAEGPIDDNLYGIASMWVFGKKINHKEVYIKISMGQPNSSVICISFHVAEHIMSYPFKN